jgi:hypothetical protein
MCNLYQTLAIVCQNVIMTKKGTGITFVWVLKKWSCHAYNLIILSWINGSNNIELYSINKIMGASLICDYWELEFPYWSLVQITHLALWPFFTYKPYTMLLTRVGVWIKNNFNSWISFRGMWFFLQFFRLGIFELVAMETGICYKYFATYSIISYDTLKK